MITYLDEIKLNHADMSFDNMVYLHSEDCLKLIDFGEAYITEDIELYNPPVSVLPSIFLLLAKLQLAMKTHISNDDVLDRLEEYRVFTTVHKNKDDSRVGEIKDSILFKNKKIWHNDLSEEMKMIFILSFDKNYQSQCEALALGSKLSPRDRLM